MATEKCRDFSKFPDKLKKEAEQCDKDTLARKENGEKVMLLGQGCTNLTEPLPTYDKTDCEIVYPADNGSKNNSYIVFGRDRPSRGKGGFSGYGGRGCTSSGMIDVVVGRAFEEHKGIVGPNFFTDAARVYLSQRADIDEYFNLPIDENIGITKSVNRSAIGIKADAVRVIGREGIRLITNPRTSQMPENTKETNSRGEEIKSDGPDRGIHLIAHGKTGRYEETNPKLPPRDGQPTTLKINRLQPLVKGENLMLALTELVEIVRDLSTFVQNFTSDQMDINQAIATHTHTLMCFGSGTASPSTDILPTWIQKMTNQMLSHVNSMSQLDTTLGTWYKNTYLSPSSPLTFLSRYNKTN